MSNQKQQYCRYLGKVYALQVKDSEEVNKDYVELNNDIFTYYKKTDSESNMQKALIAFYKRECRKIINQRLKIYQPKIKLKYKSVTVKDSNAVWGSCSSDKHLIFNWKLILLPLYIVDYVVVHELCHLKHLNHDRSFWRLVGRHYPNYKEAMKALGSDKKKRI